MLLLLHLIKHDPFSMPDEGNQKFHLKDLFDISLGIIPDRKKYYSNDEEPIYLLNLGAAIDDNSKKSFLNINRFEDLNRLNFNEVKKNLFVSDDTSTAKKQYIPQSRILGPTDYIISIRGRPKGFSMLKSINETEIKVAVTNHFIKLTPRLPYQNMSIEYLHLLLDIIVEQFISEKFTEKKLEEENIGKKYSNFNSFNVQSIRDTIITIPVSKQDQVDIYNTFMKNYNNLLEESMKIEKFRTEVYNETIKTSN